MPAPKKADPPHKLEFTTNSLRNNTVAVDTDALYFEIVTRFWHPNLTKINKLDVESRELTTIAEIAKTPGKEPKVRFGDGQWVKASEFIRYDPQGVYVPLSVRALTAASKQYPEGGYSLEPSTWSTGGKLTSGGFRFVSYIHAVAVVPVPPP
jgi:hypothetical protein